MVPAAAVREAVTRIVRDVNAKPVPTRQARAAPASGERQPMKARVTLAALVLAVASRARLPAHRKAMNAIAGRKVGLKAPTGPVIRVIAEPFPYRAVSRGPRKIPPLTRAAGPSFRLTGRPIRPSIAVGGATA